MYLEKNPKTRKIYRRLLALEDKVSGVAFPKMKRVKQITASHCGPAVLVELFSFLGHEISQTAVVKTLRAQRKIKNYGLNIKDLARAARHLGHDFVFWHKANATASDLSRIINKYKYPVGVEWQGQFWEFADEDDGHYGVITQIDIKRGILRLADSFHVFHGVDRRFKIANFLKRWWDVNEIKIESGRRKIIDRQMMFVITEKGESWPKKLGMIKG